MSTSRARRKDGAKKLGKDAHNSRTVPASVKEEVIVSLWHTVLASNLSWPGRSKAGNHT